MKRVYFVRHGEAEGNVGNFAQSPDTPLTDRGWQQARIVGERLRHLEIDVLVASNYLRAQQTAAAIAETSGHTIETLESVRECGTPSRLRGVPRESDEYQAYIQNYAARYTDPAWENEDGETFAQVLERCEHAAAWLENHEAGQIAVVSHGRFFRFFLAYVLMQKQLTATAEIAIASSATVTNTGITHYKVEDGVWKLVSWNDHAHFAE
ncbi:MAG TPA: histidine phosphatase family protein [Candidatus Paceibacterota bacterium]|nr:histidine phosphatase family protein [Candidatus Paceibacterota bacterium]